MLMRGHFLRQIECVSVTEEVLGDGGGDPGVLHAPGAGQADHLDPACLAAAAAGVVPDGVALELARVAEFLLARLAAVHEGLARLLPRVRRRPPRLLLQA